MAAARFEISAQRACARAQRRFARAACVERLADRVDLTGLQDLEAVLVEQTAHRADQPLLRGGFERIGVTAGGGERVDRSVRDRRAVFGIAALHAPFEVRPKALVEAEPAGRILFPHERRVGVHSLLERGRIVPSAPLQ
jgi:hypothetical protein